jgi:hypothetical protein
VGRTRPEAFESLLDHLRDPLARITKDFEVVHVLPLGWKRVPETRLLLISGRKLVKVLRKVLGGILVGDRDVVGPLDEREVCDLVGSGGAGDSDRGEVGLREQATLDRALGLLDTWVEEFVDLHVRKQRLGIKQVETRVVAEQVRAPRRRRVEQVRQRHVPEVRGQLRVDHAVDDRYKVVRALSFREAAEVGFVSGLPVDRPVRDAMKNHRAIASRSSLGGCQHPCGAAMI